VTDSPTHDPAPEAPKPALRRRLLLVGALAALAAGAAGAAMTIGLGFSAAAGLKGAALVAALLAVSAPQLEAHPFPALGAANQLTLARAALVGALAACIGEPAAAWGDWLAVGAVLALAGDVADGALARRTGMASDFGGALDMELDALTVLVLGALCWQLDKAGAWILASGAMRYVFVAASWGLPWMNAPLYDSLARKLVCGVQIGTLAVCLFTWIPAAYTAPALALSLVALTWSFGRDTLWLYRNR